MPSFTATLSRDLRLLFSRRSVWVILALWAAISSVMFFAYLEDFLAIQPTLRAKNFRYGVTDIVIIPYIKLQITFALVVMASLCSRLFYQEFFSPFSALARSTRPPPLAVVCAKTAYIQLIAVALIALFSLPVWVSGYFFEYNAWRVIITLLGGFMVLLSVGVLAMVFSQLFTHSTVVMLLTTLCFIAPEIAVRLVTDPAWIAPILAFFSPLTHVSRLATGVVTLSDGVFFIGALLLLFGIAVRQFNNTYLST